MDETPPNKIYQIDKILKPFEELWQLVKNYQINNQSWSKDSIFKLNSDEIDLQAKTMYKTAFQLSNSQIIVKIAPLSIKVAEELCEEIS